MHPAFCEDHVSEHWSWKLPCHLWCTATILWETEKSKRFQLEVTQVTQYLCVGKHVQSCPTQIPPMSTVYHYILATQTVMGVGQHNNLMPGWIVLHIAQWHGSVNTYVWPQHKYGTYWPLRHCRFIDNGTLMSVLCLYFCALAFDYFSTAWHEYRHFPPESTSFQNNLSNDGAQDRINMF